MARNNTRKDDLAGALRAAIAGVRREMRTVPAEKAGALAVKIAALGRELAAEEARRAEAAEPSPDELVRMRAEFDAEVERLIEARVAERVAALTGAAR